jgi:hypothetical protein
MEDQQHTITTESHNSIVDDSVVTPEGYMRYFVDLSIEEIVEVWMKCVEAGCVVAECPTNVVAFTRDELGQLLADLLKEIPHVDVVIACDACDAHVVEVLMSKPIFRDGPTRPDPQAVPHVRPNGSRSSTPRVPKDPSLPRVAAPAPDDPRIIATLKDNPKKVSSQSFQRYALYKVGMSVAEFIAAGGTKGDVQHDLSKGFITLVSPEEFAAAQ